MDMNRAVIFVRVVDHGGFTAAARVLGLPKSSVSRSVSLLEDELGVRLLTRTTRAVRVTEAGSAFYERASRGIAGVEEAAAAVADMQGAIRGLIRITAPVDLGISLLGPALARFATLYPEVRVEVMLSGRVVDLVDEGFDLAVRAGALRDTSLVARRLPSLDFTLRASADYLSRRGAPKSLADLAKHDCVVFRPVRGGTTWTLNGPEGVERVDVTSRIASDDLLFVGGAVASGMGIGLLPEFLARDLPRVLPKHSLEGSPLHLVYPSARYMPQRVAVLRDHLAREFGSLRTPGGISPRT